VLYVVPSLNVTVIDPVPVVVILNVAVAPSQIVVLPVMFAVGLGTTVIVVVGDVVITAPNASVILLIVTVADPTVLIAPTANAIPLLTVAVPVDPPATVYPIVNGSAPLVASYVTKPVPPIWIVLPLNVPTGRGFTTTTTLVELTVLHVPLTCT
jgi:hypothetical protein